MDEGGEEMTIGGSFLAIIAGVILALGAFTAWTLIEIKRHQK